MTGWTDVDLILAHVASRGYARICEGEAAVQAVVKRLRRNHFSTTSSTLGVKGPDDARNNTLSKKHGLDAFPFHTDYAFRAIPPRYILLTNKSEISVARPTYIADLRGLPEDVLQQIRCSVWTLRTRRGHFLVNSCFQFQGKPVWRWDCDFLAPANNNALRAIDAAPRAMQAMAREIRWKPNEAALIDNWRCVHARGQEPHPTGDIGRVLIRTEFWCHARMDF